MQDFWFRVVVPHLDVLYLTDRARSKVKEYISKGFLWLPMLKVEEASC